MARPKFQAPKGVESQFRVRLREVARFVGQIVKGHTAATGLVDERGLIATLGQYSEVLGPWADRLVTRMLDRVQTSNLRDFASLSGQISRGLRDTLADARVGAVTRRIHADQVQLIKSLPIEAGQRAQKIAQEALVSGDRAGSIAKSIRDLDNTGAVTEARAVMIARTEIAKANSALTQARAQFVGSTHYIWRTMGDADVRDSHAALDGQVFAWDAPPFVDDDEGSHHPGDIWNDRCYAEPVLTGVDP